MQTQKPAKFLTNFDAVQLPAYQEAIRRFGGSVRRTRLTIGRVPNCDSMRSLYCAGLKPGGGLDSFWWTLDKVRAEMQTASLS